MSTFRIVKAVKHLQYAKVSFNTLKFICPFFCLTTITGLRIGSIASVCDLYHRGSHDSSPLWKLSVEAIAISTGIVAGCGEIIFLL